MFRLFAHSSEKQNQSCSPLFKRQHHQRGWALWSCCFSSPLLLPAAVRIPPAPPRPALPLSPSLLLARSRYEEARASAGKATAVGAREHRAASVAGASAESDRRGDPEDERFPRLGRRRGQCSRSEVTPERPSGTKGAAPGVATRIACRPQLRPALARPAPPHSAGAGPTGRAGGRHGADGVGLRGAVVLLGSLLGPSLPGIALAPIAPCNRAALQGPLPSVARLRIARLRIDTEGSSREGAAVESRITTEPAPSGRIAPARGPPAARASARGPSVVPARAVSPPDHT